MIRLYLDTEFTSLNRYRAKLISVALVAETGNEFYVELTDAWVPADCSEFVVRKVLPQLDHPTHGRTTEQARAELIAWLTARGPAEIITGAPEHDWPLLLWLAWPQGFPVNVRPEPGKLSVESDAICVEDSPHRALQDARILAGLVEQSGRHKASWQIYQKPTRTFTRSRRNHRSWAEMRTIIFDAFGKLIQRAKRRENPYARLVTPEASAGLRHQVLTRNVPIDVFAREQGLEHLIPLLRREIEQEIAALAIYPDVLETIAKLRGAGHKIAVCSNLAFEYCATVRLLLLAVDEFIFSCEVGAAKPQPQIYDEACQRLRCRPRDVFFVGDSRRADFEGPVAYGMRARLIEREAGENLESALLAAAK